MTAADHTPSLATDGLREAAIRRIEESRASHLAWAEHIPHCDHCRQHGPPPYIQDEAEHRQIVAEYDVVLAVLATSWSEPSGMSFCDLDHGGEGNPATVYGHYGSPRTCIRLHDSRAWVYDPRWEKRLPQPAPTVSSDGLREAVEALASRWSCNCGGPSPEGHHEMHCDSYYGAELRAVLAAHPAAPTPEETPSSCGCHGGFGGSLKFHRHPCSRAGEVEETQP